jgi:large subunit ribosomal protein L13
MDMNKTFFLRKEDEQQAWTLFDAEDKVLGRLATKIADTLRGKDQPEYTPHSDAGKHVVIINAEKIKLTGNKATDKEYIHYTGWVGGQRTRTAKQLMEKDPREIILLAVKRMLPKSRMGDKMLTKLKVYVGNEHPHKAQVKQAA